MAGVITHLLSGISIMAVVITHLLSGIPFMAGVITHLWFVGRATSTIIISKTRPFSGSIFHSSARPTRLLGSEDR